MLLLENSVYYTAIIPPLKRQGARDFDNEPVAGSGLLFSFDNINSSTTVRIVRQIIPFAGLIMSRFISFVENHNLALTPSNGCMVILVVYCLSLQLKYNEYTAAMKYDRNLGVIIHHSSTLALIKKIQSIIVSSIGSCTWFTNYLNL